MHPDYLANLLGFEQIMHHIEHHERLHAGVTEAFPALGDAEGEEAAGVAEPFR